MTPHQQLATQLLGLWGKFEADFSAQRPPPIAPDSKPFIEYAWDDFIVQDVMHVLTAPGTSYFGHKAVLFAGFLTWVVCPKEPSLRRDSMTLTTMELVAGAEDEARKYFGDLHLLADTVARILIPGIDFFREIYHPIGGLRAISKCTKQSELSIKIREHSTDIASALRVMKVIHFHTTQLLPTGHYDKPSIERACDAVAAIDNAHVSSAGKDSADTKRALRAVDLGNTKKRWNQFALSAPYFYAASTISLSDKQTLLDVSRTGEATYESSSGSLGELLGRANYVAHEILSKCYKNPTLKASIQNVFEAPPCKIDCPVFTDREIEILQRVFK